MSQDLTQEFAKGGNTTGGSTGSTVLETSLYKATDGKIEFILYLEKDTPYPTFPGGNGTKKCTWTRLGTSDANRTSFTSVKVVAGTL